MLIPKHNNYKQKIKNHNQAITLLEQTLTSKNSAEYIRSGEKKISNMPPQRSMKTKDMHATFAYTGSAKKVNALHTLNDKSNAAVTTCNETQIHTKTSLGSQALRE